MKKHHLSYLIAVSIVILSMGSLKAQENVPEGYQLLYHQDFSSATAISQFEMSDKKAWKSTTGEQGWLELFGKSEYEARVRSPFNIALLKDYYFGDFVLEADLAQSGREYGHRDLCLFFGAKDATNFYYVHIATKADPHANNIFLVNDAPRVAIASKTTDGTNWGETNSWHKVRIERDITEGTIKVFFDDMSNPIMEATDTHFDYGRIGFGSFDDTGRFDNIKVWGPGVYPSEGGFFE
jgi:hypothetical protein